MHFEGPAPRPLERLKIALGPDGQIIIDKSKKISLGKRPMG
jgi:cytochrome b6-f complex iron-sulfur subunit